jgi:hypothetical protein
MDQTDFEIHAGDLQMLYTEIENDVKAYVHDPAAHNLCSAVVEGYSSIGKTSRDFNQTYFSYSAPKALPGWVRSKYLKCYLIPLERPMGARFHGKGMGLLHTEVRLINFLWAFRNDPGILPAAGEINFFSTRTVCGGCQKHIAMAQKEFSGIGIAFRAFELQAEAHGGDPTGATHVYMGNARRGTGGTKRESTTDLGSFA